MHIQVVEEVNANNLAAFPADKDEISAYTDWIFNYFYYRVGVSNLLIHKYKVHAANYFTYFNHRMTTFFLDATKTLNFILYLSERFNHLLHALLGCWRN